MFSAVFHLIDIIVRQRTLIKCSQINIKEAINKQLVHIVIFILKECLK